MMKAKTQEIKFDEAQKREILEGLRNGLSQTHVSLYAKTNLTPFQMREIRLGLQHGVDVSSYASPEIPLWKMKQAREKLELEKQQKKNLTVQNSLKPKK